MNLKKLKYPFPDQDIEWRVQSAGETNGKYWCRVLAYVTNRAIMDRLDKICGAENWKNEFQKAPEGGILCGLSIKIGDEWIVKFDGAENTNVESVKGGLSSAMKRAGVQWGIGRYLYKLEATFGHVLKEGKFSAKTKEGKYFKWNPPDLPTWALPKQKGDVEEKKSQLEKIKDIEILSDFRKYLSVFEWEKEDEEILRILIRTKEEELKV